MTKRYPLHHEDARPLYLEIPQDEYDRIISRIAELEARNHDLEEERRWRKFSEEKPKENTWCIVFHDGEIDSDHYARFAYNKKCDFALYGNEVTHWMPLPKAPEKEAK